MVYVFFFFKQMTAYEMRISDWSSDVCSSDLLFLGWPWGWDEVKQMCGRFLRPGISVPVEINVLESENSIDQGFFDLVRIKRSEERRVGKGVSVRVDLGGRRIIKKKKKRNSQMIIIIQTIK